MEEKLILTWDDIDKCCLDFAKSNEKKYDYIIAVARGGLPIGVILAHMMGIKTVLTFQASIMASDEVGAEHSTLKFGRNINFDCIKGKKVLLVDEVCDSGATLEGIKTFLETETKDIDAFVIATIDGHLKDGCRMPEYSCMTTDKWISFPWEKYENIKTIK